MKRFLTECTKPSIFWSVLRLRIDPNQTLHFQSQSEARISSKPIRGENGFNISTECTTQHLFQNVFDWSKIHAHFKVALQIGCTYVSNLCHLLVFWLASVVIDYRNFPSDRIFGKQPEALLKAWSHILTSSKFLVVHLTFFPIVPWIQFVLVTPCHLEDLVAPGKKIQKQ